MSSNRDVIVSVKNLKKSYDKSEVLKGINYEIERGELISIIGRSGCGKTTFLRCLNTLETLDSGTISIDGITIHRDKSDPVSNDEGFKIKSQALRERVGMLFQDLNLFPNLNVLQNVTIAPIIVKNISKSKAEEEAKKQLEKVGMCDFLKRYPYQLSGGQAQRVAIARALAMNPRVMLYDEPTSALDPELVGEVIQVMRKLHDEGMTQLVVTHSMRFAKTASDKIIYMDDGKIVESGTPHKMFENPSNPLTRMYLDILYN